LSALISEDHASSEILHLLSKHREENPNSSGLDRAIIQDTLKLTEGQLELNMLCLQKRALITLSGSIGSKWVFADITPEGISEITNGIQDKVQEPSIENLPDYMAEAFKQARYQIGETNLPNSNKERIGKQLKDLEAELRKGRRADWGKIQKMYSKLNENPYGITPAISKAVLETVKIALNLQ
jgi:hypothetical protein